MTSNKKNRSDYQNNKNGFSLAEVIIVVSILGIILTTGFMSFGDSKQRLALDQAQSNLMFALEQAQNRSATGFGTSKHGVRINGNEIIIFEGADFENRVIEETIPLLNVTTGELNFDIIFERIKATTTTESITLTHSNGKTKIININPNGKISTQ